MSSWPWAMMAAAAVGLSLGFIRGVVSVALKRAGGGEL